MHGILLIGAALLAAVPEIELQRLDGQVLGGELVRMDNTQLVIRTAQGEEAVSVKGLLGVKLSGGQTRTIQHPHTIRLIDGSVLTGSSFTSDMKEARLSSEPEKPLAIPTVVICSVQLTELDADTKSRWDELVENGPAADVIAVRKKEATSTTFLEGVIGPVTDETVEFQLDGDTIPVKRDRVQGLIYYRKRGSASQDPTFMITSHSGERIAGKSLAYADGIAKVVSVAGVEITRPLDQFSGIDFSSGKLNYLSDLAPLSFEWAPYLKLPKSSTSLADFYALRRDRGRTSEALTLDGKSYAKGISLASRSEVRYKVPPQSRKLQAIAGIDDTCGDRGHVVLTISGDGRQLFQTTVAGRDPPKPIDVDLSGVSELSILVDFGEQMDIGDQLNLCEARITK